MTQTHQRPGPQPTAEPILLTLKEAADQLQVSVDTLVRRANVGEIPTIRIGRRRLVSPADLEAFIAQQREEHERHEW